MDRRGRSGRRQGAASAALTALGLTACTGVAPHLAVSLTGRAMDQAVLSIGSNLGDRLAHLQAAVTLLQPDAVSPVYETAPVGGPEQQPYLNAVMVLPVGDPFDLLRFTSRIEASRQRERIIRWGSDVWWKAIGGDRREQDPEPIVRQAKKGW